MFKQERIEANEVEQARLASITEETGILLAGRRYESVAPPACERPVVLPAPASAPAIDNGPSDQRALKAYRPRTRHVRIAPRVAAENVKAPPRFGKFKLQQLSDKHCHFPVTDEAPFLFCGRPKPDDDTMPYCRQCALLAYRWRSTERRS